MPLASEVRDHARRQHQRGVRGGRKHRNMGESFNRAILSAVVRPVKRMSRLPETFTTLKSMSGQMKALVVVEASHVVRQRVRECRGSDGFGVRVCECDREKIVVEYVRTPSFKDKFKRSSTLFGLRVRRADHDILPIMVRKWDEAEGRIVFDVHSDVFACLKGMKRLYMIRPLEIMTSYRRMYVCDINGLTNRSPKLVQALLGRPPPKHVFFVDGDQEDNEEIEAEKHEIVNGRSRGGSFGEWCALARNIKQHRRERKENEFEIAAIEKKKDSRNSMMKTNLNTSQTHAISCFLKGNEPLYMIHGPPGTGKTKTIVGMLRTLLCGDKPADSRVVVCAPSNKAVYVILRSYITKVMSLKSSSVKPLLVGVEDGLPSDLRPYFVHDAKAHFNVDVSNIEVSISSAANNNTSTSASRLLENASRFLKDLRLKLTSRCPETSKLLRRTVTLLENRLKSFQYQGGLNDFLKLGEFQKIARKLRDDVNDLNEFSLEREWASRSQLVFCTLACSGRDILRRRRPCDLLIIDEAAQAVEAECLIALQLRPRQILFVGDPNQLSATAQSDVAKRAGYERSTMQRLYVNPHLSVYLLLH